MQSKSQTYLSLHCSLVDKTSSFHWQCASLLPRGWKPAQAVDTQEWVRGFELVHNCSYLMWKSQNGERCWSALSRQQAGNRSGITNLSGYVFFCWLAYLRLCDSRSRYAAENKPSSIAGYGCQITHLWLNLTSVHSVGWGLFQYYSETINQTACKVIVKQN